MDDLFKAIEQVAAHKRMRAQAMRQGVDPTLEKAQDVAGAVSDALAARFTGADAFSYARSGRKLKRKVGDWTQEIRFDGLGSNTPGRVIQFRVHGYVRNAVLKKWQKSVASPFWNDVRGDIVAVPTTYNIPGWPLEGWNLHEEAHRPAIMDEAERAIREKLFPTFELFCDRERLRQRLHRETKRFNERLVALDTAIDLMLFYFDGLAAAELVDRFVEQHGSPEMPGMLAAAWGKFSSGTRPSHVLSDETEIAALAVAAYNLPVRDPMLLDMRGGSAVPEQTAPSQQDSGAAILDMLRAAGFNATQQSPQRTPELDASCIRMAQSNLKMMRNEKLSPTKRINAAHLACVSWDGVGDDAKLWRILAERLELGLVNRKSVMWPFTKQLVERLKARSTPPAGCEHVADAYLNDPSKTKKRSR